MEAHFAYESFLPLFTPFECSRAPLECLSVSAAEIDLVKPRYEAGSEADYIEHMELSLRAGDALLAHKRALFHGVAFKWHDKAYIISGQSGAGKSTHYVQWKRLYGGEIALINGDKPILDLSVESVTVCPSPWRGKENMGSMETAPLGGIVFLVRGEENAMCRMEIREAAPRLFTQFLITAEKEQDVRLACGLEERLLGAVPIWLLHSRGDAACAKLCHDTLEREMCKR